MVKFKNVRFGQPLAGVIHQTKRAASKVCSDPAFYKTPQWNSVMASSDTFTVTWDTSSQYQSCLNGVSTLDIYLTSAQLPDGKIQKFTPISFESGSYSRSLDPKWWGGLPNIQASVTIAPTGTPLFLNSFSTGPLINITYNGVETAASNGTSSDPTLANSAAGILQRGSLSNGAIAAAILIPILAVVATVLAYIKISRVKQAEKSRRFTQALDARMSRISGDWQALAAPGAPQALRDSNMRMSKVFVSEMQMDTRPSTERPSVSIYGRPSGETVGTRTSRFNPSIGERHSRISFAADVNASKERLSTYSTGRTSRAYHLGVAPPVPAIRTTIYGDHGHDLEEEDEENLVSPEQKQGPLPLTNPDDIVPALRLMRTGANPSAKSSEDLLLSPPVPPTPTYTTEQGPMSPLGASGSAPPLSPVGMMPMQPLSASFMSPDAMLKHYAEARASGAKSPTYNMPTPMSPIYSLPPMSPTPSTPTLGVPQYTATGMRNLTGDNSLSNQQSQPQTPSSSDWHY